jgi:Glycosyltransferase family 17
MSKIYDCFTFYNETDLLELRLTELYEHVDKFVIVEANQTFTNAPKPWNFDAERFERFMDKIIYVQVTDMPNSTNPWDNEKHQRNAINRGLAQAELDDVVIVSDVDEIIRPEAVTQLRDSNQIIWALRMPLFNFKFNYMRSTPGQYDVWAMAARYSVLTQLYPDTLRSMRFQFMSAPFAFVNQGCELVEHAGWHFAYMTDVKTKIQNFSHQEANRPELIAQIDVDASIAERTEWDRSSANRYKIVEMSEYFPKTLSDPKYQTLILDNSEANVFDIVPPYHYN